MHSITRLGVCEVSFQEDLKWKKHEVRCLPIVAMLWAVGFRFVRDGGANHYDVTGGCRHLQDFRRTATSKLHRVITWRFIATAKTFEGVVWRPDTLARALRTDGALRAAAMALPRYERHLEKLVSDLGGSLKTRRSIEASDSCAELDKVIIPMVGGRSDHITAFARLYERE